MNDVPTLLHVLLCVPSLVAADQSVAKSPTQEFICRSSLNGFGLALTELTCCLVLVSFSKQTFGTNFVV